MAVLTERRKEQIRQAEEVLSLEGRQLGFARSLFFGHFRSDLISPWPTLELSQQEAADELIAQFREFADATIDPFEIDRLADIPQSVMQGLARLGMFGLTVPREFGGLGLSQSAAVRVMEAVGSIDASIAVMLNAHHSIGLRVILLAGTPEQKQRWLPPLARGEQLAAFALTEPEAGSDAANVQTRATPSEDGQVYYLTGEKRYITNGAIAGVLTVMARTPVPGRQGTHVTAFLVTPDLPGFEIVEARMPKCGIRGTVTSRLAFHDMPVPAANVLGRLGEGLKLALTAIDYGRITFGATCTGAAKVCLQAATRHAVQRRQFGQRLADFEMVKEKLALMAADIFAMESATHHAASLLDAQTGDYMLETAIVKVFASEALWRIVNDTIQIFGGQAYFCDEPYERMMRDARINLIGEGANDVLRAFVALVGLREVGQQLKLIADALWRPWEQWQALLRFAGRRIYFSAPTIPITHEELAPEASRLADDIAYFGKAVESALLQHREGIVEKQYIQKRLADAATELYLSSCVLSRLDSMLHVPDPRTARLLNRGRLFLAQSSRRLRHYLQSLRDNDDALITTVANETISEIHP
ncbi:MAG: acyl-CoA dehydrogenase family protein [Gemmatales bacterium]|nr:acyl-CoA dehydrogenase family protein [Gemmatales bacterium]MDW7994376.1 acyl-CoA dehydrogenase family protein [Gemmatales bacterium]